MKKLNIALVAHDARKQELVKWCTFNSSILKHHNLFATGTTGSLIAGIPVDSENTAYPLKDIQLLKSGPLGGDQQIGARIAYNEIDLVLFFRDPLTAQPHEPDVSALFRLCDVHNIPLATNSATAEVLIQGLERGDLAWRDIVNPKNSR
jgi:methylglyoxal synthase